MSFFKKTNGEVLAAATVKTEAQNGGFTIIPDETTCNAMISGCEIKTASQEFGGERFVNIQWTVLAPTVYANIKVNQKIKLFDHDGAKFDKALDMFAAIDKNATGGKLIDAGVEPTDYSMAVLLNAQMQIKVMKWELSGREGNWVSKVSAKGSTQQVVAKPVAVAVDDADIPF